MHSYATTTVTSQVFKLQALIARLSSGVPHKTRCDCGSEMALSRIYHHPKTISHLYICGHCGAADRVSVRLAQRRKLRASRIAMTMVILATAYLTARAFIPFTIHLFTGG